MQYHPAIAKGWKSAGSNALSLNTTDKEQGEASIEMTGKDGQEFKKAFSPVYDAQGTVDNTILKFSYYVSDVSLFTNEITIEISSSGAADTAEYNWTVNKTELVNGWNDIELRVSDAGISLGGIPTEPDLSAINWFRLFGGKTDVITTRIDGIQLFNEDVVLSVNSINKANIKIYPNPSKDFIELSNQIETKNYKLYNKLGQLVKKGTLDVNEKINIQNLNQGLYILKFDNGASLKLLKQ